MQKNGLNMLGVGVVTVSKQSKAVLSSLTWEILWNIITIQKSKSSLKPIPKEVSHTQTL